MKLSLPSLSTPARRVLLALLLSGTAATAAQAQNNVGVGTTTPNASAVLDVSSSTQGLLAPRLSQAQRDAIVAPATGLLVYQLNNTPGFYVYNGAAWTAVGGSGATGATGPQGPAGPTGATGPQGPIGNTGPAGATGAQGPTGNTGPAGAAGAQGPAGPIGATGAQGPIGNTGPAGAAGAQGPIGNTGPAGATGAAGAQGPIGNTGPAGATGTTGPQGPIGNTGAVGPAGPTGATGPIGPAGATGAVGPAGPVGAVGPAGPAGATGPQGAAGQGVPTGGTAGQVLTKIDATNYNTQWTTPTGGSGTFPSIELSVANNVQQTISSLFNTSNFTTLTLSGTNAGTLTGGNTWNGTTFTVGSTGAGWYQVTSNFLGVASGSNGVVTIGYQVALDKNGSFGTSPTAGTYPLAFTTYDSSVSSSILKNHALIQTVVFLAAGDFLNFRAQSWSTSTSAYTSTEGSSNVQIVRLK